MVKLIPDEQLDRIENGIVTFDNAWVSTGVSADKVFLDHNDLVTLLQQVKVLQEEYIRLTKINEVLRSTIRDVY